MAGIPEHHKRAISAQYYKSLRYNRDIIQHGTVLCIDPSSGGNSSLPGYALMYAGEVIDSGEIPVSGDLRVRGAYVGHRLYEIGAQLRALFPFRVELLGVELIYHTPSDSTIHKSFQQLNMALGTIHSSIDAKYRIVIPAWEWWKMRGYGYTKTDENDAICMAKALVGDSSICK